MTKLKKCGAKDTCVLGIVEEGTDFGLGGGGEHVLHDNTGDVDGAVVGNGNGIGDRRIGGATEEENAAGTGSGMGFRKIGSVAVNVQDHGAGGVTNGGVGMRVGVVKKLVGRAHGGNSGAGLRSGEGMATSMVQSRARA